MMPVGGVVARVTVTGLPPPPPHFDNFACARLPNCVLYDIPTWALLRRVSGVGPGETDTSDKRNVRCVPFVIRSPFWTAIFTRLANPTEKSLSTQFSTTQNSAEKSSLQRSIPTVCTKRIRMKGANVSRILNRFFWKRWFHSIQTRGDNQNVCAGW